MIFRSSKLNYKLTFMRFLKGQHFSPKTEFTSERMMGNKINLGRHHSKETIEKIRKSRIGKSSGMIGKKQSEETKRKMSLSHGGSGIPQYSTKRYYHKCDWRYKEWRSKVFERDNWTCQTCNKRGIPLEPHHIKGWTKYPELRYEVENGVSLCIECHRLTRKVY